MVWLVPAAVAVVLVATAADGGRAETAAVAAAAVDWDVEEKAVGVEAGDRPDLQTLPVGAAEASRLTFGQSYFYFHRRCRCRRPRVEVGAGDSSLAAEDIGAGDVAQWFAQ